MRQQIHYLCTTPIEKYENYKLKLNLTYKLNETKKL